MTENLFKQTISIKNRNYFEADNVEEVLVFDESNVVLSVGGSVFSELIIGGSELSIISLDSQKKTVAVKGHIDAVVYSDRGGKNKKNSKKGFLSRIFD
jgi:sporulation protein YabP